MTIYRKDYLWIRDNPETFRKCLHSYFNFIGKNLSHWRIDVNLSKDHLVMVTLYKDGLIKEWFSINGSGGGSNKDYVSGYIYSNKPDRRSSVYFKQLEPIWNESFKSEKDYRDNFLTDLFKIIERDQKLKELLN